MPLLYTAMQSGASEQGLFLSAILSDKCAVCRHKHVFCIISQFCYNIDMLHAVKTVHNQFILNHEKKSGTRQSAWWYNTMFIITAKIAQYMITVKSTTLPLLLVAARDIRVRKFLLPIYHGGFRCRCHRANWSGACSCGSCAHTHRWRMHAVWIMWFNQVVQSGDIKSDAIRRPNQAGPHKRSEW